MGDVLVQVHAATVNEVGAVVVMGQAVLDYHSGGVVGPDSLWAGVPVTAGTPVVVGRCPGHGGATDVSQHDSAARAGELAGWVSEVMVGDHMRHLDAGMWVFRSRRVEGKPVA